MGNVSDQAQLSTGPGPGCLRVVSLRRWCPWWKSVRVMRIGRVLNELRTIEVHVRPQHRTTQTPDRLQYLIHIPNFIQDE